MRLAAVPAVATARGIDTIATISPQYAKWLYDNGYRFVCRYLSSLTLAEVTAIVSAGLAVIPCTYADDFDPAHAIAGMQKAGLPFGVTVFLDVESVKLAKDDVTARMDRWFKAMRAAGYDPGLYVGAGVPLTGDELGALACDRYWHSCSFVPEVTLHGGPLGYCMRQLRPPNIFRGGVQVDEDVIEQDYRGRVPTWAQLDL
jgi:hypothetical protein